MIITPDEFAKVMKEIRDEYGEHDEEVMHVLMDELMCKVLKQFGYDEGVTIFDDAHKWYA